MSMEVQQFLNDTGGNFTEMAPRPPVPGEETAELQSNGGISTRSSGSHKSHLSGKSHSSGKSVASHRSDVSHSPAATPRRSNLDKTLCASSLSCSDSKLDSTELEDAPLGFEPEGSAANSPPFTENSTPPYLKWAENLKYLLDDSDGVKLFKQYLDIDSCTNLLDFWFACNGLKMVDENDFTKILSLSKLIYKKYIKGDQLALKSEIKKAIVERLKNDNVDQTLFNDAQTEVENMMKNDAYPQFLKSDIYLQYVQNGGESPKTSNNSSGSSSARPLSGPLPTLHEGEELKTDDIRTSAPVLLLTSTSLLSTRRSREAWSMRRQEKLVAHSSMYPPSSGKMPNPYHVSYATVSAQDSELQSLSSDAQTDDTMSLTDADSSVDGRDLSGYGKKAWKKHQKAIKRYADTNKHTQLNQHLIPRTERAPKDRNLAEKEPAKFASLLTERLLKVKEEREKLMRIKENLQNLEETDDESDSARMPPPLTCVAPKAVIPPPPTNPLNMLLALADKDREDNAQSILEDHVSRVWDSSNGQTPTRSPGRHSPKSWDISARYPYAPGPSPNVSASTLFSNSFNKSHSRKKGDKDASNMLSTSSYDSGMGVEDKTGVFLETPDTHHKYVYHHHHHHHHVLKDNTGKTRTIEAETPHNRSLHYHASAPVLQNFTEPHRGYPSHNHSQWEEPSRSRSRDFKRSGPKRGTDSSSNIDSGVGIPGETNQPNSVPNIHDPTNEKVLSWMLENEKMSTVNTQYSTDGSDKGSSQKQRSHKSSNNSQHKSNMSGSSKKSSSQFNSSRSGSLDRSGFNSFHQPVGGDYSFNASSLANTSAPLLGVQPGQPFIQDPSMPLLNPPNPMTQLEEARRRLEDESNKARVNMKQSRSFTAGATSSSRDRRAMPPPSFGTPRGNTVSYPPPPPRANPSNQSYSKNIPQVAPLDLSSSEDHSSHGSHKSESRRSQKKPSTSSQSGDHTVVGYYFCSEPIPYRTTLAGKNITLVQFKQLISKKGSYRYYFKTASDEFDSGVVHEEITIDSQVLPLWDGKIIGKVEKKE